MTRRRTKILAGSILAASHAVLAFGQTSSTWINDVGTAGGSWSVAGNWLGGAVADGGGTASFNTLATFTSAPLSIFQDQPTVTLNGIAFNTQITYQLRIPAATTNTITLAGPATLTTPIPSINTLSVTSFGQLVDLPITGSSGLTKNGPGTVSLWRNTNTYTGGTTVNDGVLVLRQIGDAGFGNASGGVTFDGGTIRITTTAWTSGRAITLNAGGGTIEATTTGTTTFNGVVTGNGLLNKSGARGLTMTASNDYSGATNVLAGSIGLSGNGAIAATSALTVRDSLVLDNAGTNLLNRVNNAAPLTLHGATVIFTGNAAAASSETFGDTTFSRGTTVVTVTPGSGQSASVALGDVRRDAGGAAFFRGTALGSTPGNNVANVTFNTAPTLVGGDGADGSTNVSIIPWAVGNTSSAAALNAATNGFVTYGANGVRPLDVATEYVTTIPSGVTTANVRQTVAGVLSDPATINSLILAGSSGLAVTGSSTLTITSGAVLSLNNGNNLATPLEFGSAEAIINAQGSLTLSGAINGSGGLSKHGAGVATFSSTNTYTGVTTLGGGTAVFTTGVASGAPSAFGNSTTAVQLAPAGLGTGGTTARLTYSGATPASFERDLNVTGRVALNNSATIPGFGLSTATTLTMSGDIALDSSPLGFTGTAGSTLVVDGDISGTGGPVTDSATGTGTIRLNGDNSFTGGAELSGATWQVGSDTAFGDGGLLKMVQLSGQPTIQAVGGSRTITNPTVSFSSSANYWQVGGSNDLTFTGSINLSGSYTHNISNIALTTYAGVLHTGGFTKAGPGTLVLTNSNIYSGNTTINSGVLRVSNSGALGTLEAPTIIAAGAALELTGNALTSEPVTANGTGIAGGGALVNVSGNNSVGPITVATSALANVASGSTLKTGNVTVAAGQTFSKAGTGELSVERVRGGGLSVDAGRVAVSAGRDPNKTSVVTALSVGATSSLDLGNNDLIIDYTVTSPFAVIQAALTSGYAAGAWNGPGINSAVAGANPGTALGIAEAADVIPGGSGTFSGQMVDDTTVLIRYTLAGDADLSGGVNLDDFTRLAAGFGAGSSWAEGDFNYDGVVNLDDFTALAANFGQSLPTDAARSSVPEPTTGLVGALALGFLRRRRSMK